MSQNPNTAIAMGGVDIGKNLLGLIGAAASEVVAWPNGSTICQLAVVPDRHGSLRWRASGYTREAH
jgi:hypothetical protein